MERETKLGIASRCRSTGNHLFGASSQVKVQNEETSLSLSQWLHPSKLPRSYLALLNEESTPDEKPPLDYVVEKVVLPSRDDAETGARGVIRTIYSGASETDGICSGKIGTSKVKPSIRVQNRSNDETYGSSSQVPVAGRSSNKSEHSSSHKYYEKLRSWKERSNNNNHDFSQLYGRYRSVPSKQFNKSKNKSWTTEFERKQRIENNIKALGELLPHEVEDTAESILNDVIAHVKLMQLQMKELSRSRLGGEAISQPMISIEGYGHFVNQEQTMRKPMEEIMADLLTNDPDAAATLLESKGLYLMPLSWIQGFC